MNYQFDVPFTKTKHAFYTGQKAIATSDVNLRLRPTTGNDELEPSMPAKFLPLMDLFNMTKIQTITILYGIQ